MDWLNLHSSTLDSPEFVRSDPVRRSAWLCLLRYCIGQENSGVIKNCKGWGDSTWQQLCRVKLKEVKLESELWFWDNDDLRVIFYPLEKQREIQSNRINGAMGGRPKVKPKDNRVVFDGFAIAETERKGKEEEGKEGELHPTRAHKIRSYIESFGAKTIKGDEDLLLEWEAYCKGLKNKDIESIFKTTKPGILWPSQFRDAREAVGI